MRILRFPLATVYLGSLERDMNERQKKNRRTKVAPEGRSWCDGWIKSSLGNQVLAAASITRCTSEISLPRVVSWSP